VGRLICGYLVTTFQEKVSEFAVSGTKVQDSAALRQVMFNGNNDALAALPRKIVLRQPGLRDTRPELFYKIWRPYQTLHRQTSGGFLLWVHLWPLDIMRSLH